MTAQYEIVKYDIGESYESDEMYQHFKNKELEAIAELNVLRDSIIYSERLDPEEKLYALQLFNNLYDDPENLRRLITILDSTFAWFKFSPRKKVERLVDDLCTSVKRGESVRNTYDNLRSNIYYYNMKKVPDDVKEALKFLGLNKSKEPASIYFKRIFGNVRIDKCLRNKDIYWDEFIIAGLSWSWWQQIYAHKRNSKRNNNFYSRIYNPEVKTKENFLDYIIDGPSAMLYNNSGFLNMLKHGGRYYVKLKFLSEREYEESFNKLKVDYKEDKPKRKREPRFTEESLKEFIAGNDLVIEKEAKDGRYTSYVFRKK